MQHSRINHFAQTHAFTAAIGELDRHRNLKIAPFVGFVLSPVFRELQPRLRYAEMGRRGITPMQYYQEFVNHPAPFGYGDAFDGRYEIRLCRSASDEPRGPDGALQRVERLIVETRATLTGRSATGAPAALGYEPEVGMASVAGTGRVLHVLTQPNGPPGRRGVAEIPPELDFLAPQALDGPYPTIVFLDALEDGFGEIARVQPGGIWGLANTDVYQHIHAANTSLRWRTALPGAGHSGAAARCLRHRRARVIFAARPSSANAMRWGSAIPPGR